MTQDRHQPQPDLIAELEIRNRISEVFLSVTDEEVYGEVLQIVMEGLKSKYGIFGYINEEGAWV